jgi:hypothetical protein
MKNTHPNDPRATPKNKIQVIQRFAPPIPETLASRSEREDDAWEKTSGGRLSQGKMGWSNAMAFSQSGPCSVKKMGI